MTDEALYALNKLWCYMIDGRTIYFHLLIIEPKLKQIFPSETARTNKYNNATDLIKAANLFFFVELTNTDSASSDNSGMHRSVALLNSGTSKLLTQWLTIEELISPKEIEKHQNREHLGTLMKIFSDSVLCEFYRRILDYGAVEEKKDEVIGLYRHTYAGLKTHLDEIDDLIGDFSDYPLASELVACWYPCWDRFRFILGTSTNDQRGPSK